MKRQLFDQVMLVRRLTEEKDIILSEMRQHCQYQQYMVEELRSFRELATEGKLSKYSRTRTALMTNFLF